MQELLNNPAIQAAVVLVIVTALNALVSVIKQKFPTQAALVEKNWCYLQPVVGAAIDKVSAAIKTNGVAPAFASAIIAESLTKFVDQYRLFEGKDASTAEITAARAEITAAVNKVME